MGKLSLYTALGGLRPSAVRITITDTIFYNYCLLFLLLSSILSNKIPTNQLVFIEQLNGITGSKNISFELSFGSYPV